MGWSYYFRYAKGGEQTSKDWFYFTSTDDICKYIEYRTQIKKTLYIFTHNAFFDLQIINFFKYFTSNGWKLDFFYSKQLSFILNIKNKSYKICVLSTTNYFGFNLKTIGKMIGLEKLDVDFNNSDEKTLSEYCKRDVQIIVKAMLDYWSFLYTHNLGSFGLTKAGQSIIAYRSRFMIKNIYIHKNPSVQILEKNSYYGGRTECFKIGNISGGPFIFLDINSMYPFIMQSKKLPFRLYDYEKNPDIKMVYSGLKYLSCCAKCEIKTDDPAYAFRLKGKIIFPIGHFITYLTTPSLKYAIENNHLIKVLDISWYEEDYIFKDYVDYFYPLKYMYKKDKNAIYTNIVKIFLNSLYGKFGQYFDTVINQHDIECDSFSREEIYDRITGENHIITKLFNKLIETFGRQPAEKSILAIPAHITDYARMYLWEIIKTIGRDKVFYCDTDSVVIRKSDLKYVKHKISYSEIGCLGIDLETNTLKIKGLKNYITDNNRKIKGIPKTAIEIKPGTFEYWQFLGCISHMRLNEQNKIIVKKITKTLTYKYTKGNVQFNGDIKPIELTPNDC
jgi:hypothetical protein